MFNSLMYITEKELMGLRKEFVGYLRKKGMRCALKELEYVSTMGIQLPEGILRPSCEPEIEAVLKLLEGRYIVDYLAREGYGYMVHYQEPHPYGSDYYVMVKNPISSWAIEVKSQYDVCLLKKCDNEEIMEYPKGESEEFKVLAMRLGISFEYFNEFYNSLF